MAVAAHVGKVSKDYSPYGFSIMADSIVSHTAQVTAASTVIPVLYADDVDLYIESGRFTVGVVATTSAGHHFGWRLATYNASTGAATGDVLQSAVPQPSALTVNVFVDLGVNQKQVVAKGNFLALVPNDADGAGTNADVSDITCAIRYRRKA
tara:strand:+ start:13229 stop:13684 length:456 start_codon:yes stop_codon:yes gene_type:complete